MRCTSSLRQSLAEQSMSHFTAPLWGMPTEATMYLICISLRCEGYARAHAEGSGLVGTHTHWLTCRIYRFAVAIKLIYEYHDNTWVNVILLLTIAHRIAANPSRLHHSAGGSILARRACDTKWSFRNRAQLPSRGARLHKE
jgi:hypothetical protein